MLITCTDLSVECVPKCSVLPLISSTTGRSMWQWSPTKCLPVPITAEYSQKAHLLTYLHIRIHLVDIWPRLESDVNSECQLTDPLSVYPRSCHHPTSRTCLKRAVGKKKDWAANAQLSRPFCPGMVRSRSLNSWRAALLLMGYDLHAKIRGGLHSLGAIISNDVWQSQFPLRSLTRVINSFSSEGSIMKWLIYGRRFSICLLQASPWLSSVSVEMQLCTPSVRWNCLTLFSI